MATKSKGRKPSRRTHPAPRRKAAPKKRAPEAPETQAPEVIRKGAYLNVLLYVEGEQHAPDDFTKLATATVRAALDPITSKPKDGLSITLKQIEERHDIEQDDEESPEEGEGGKEERFQF